MDPCRKRNYEKSSIDSTILKTEDLTTIFELKWVR